MATAFEILKQKQKQSGAPVTTATSAFDALKQKAATQPSVAQQETQPQQQDGFLKSIIKAPIESLVVKPAARTTEALGRLGIFGQEAKKGYELQSETGQDLKTPFGRYQVEPVKSGIAGIKQIAGEALESAAYLAPQTKIAKIAGAGIKSLGVGEKVATNLGRIASGAIPGYAFDVSKNIAEGEKGAEMLKPGLTTLISAAIPTAQIAGGALIRKTKGGFATRAAKKATQIAEQTSLLEGSVPDTRIASQKLQAGKIVPDKVAKEAIRQGIPEADVALVKVATPTDKSKMIKMLDVRKQGLTNKRFAAVNRSTDVVGNTFVEKIAKPIEKLNQEAGKKLEITALRLAGKKTNPTPAITQFADDLERAGVGFRSDGSLKFKNSNFEGLKGVQSLINNVWKRANRVARTGDALQLHRTKAYIDEIVNYGKEAEGLSGKAQTMLKQFRHNIDAILDSQFPTYNKVNTQYSDTINALHKLGDSIGKSFRLGDKFVDAQSGTAMRRIFSNTQSRTQILGMVDDMQKLLKNYGIKLDDDIITQAGFADTLEKMLGSEAPTSFLGGIERGVGHAGQLTSIGADVAQATPTGAIRGTIKAGKYVLDITKGINQENKINALRALLDAIDNIQPPKSPSVFGRPPKISNKAFHGTNKKFDKFDVNRSIEGELGKGIYFSKDLDTSKRFGTNIKEISLDNLNLKKFNRSNEFSQEFNTYSGTIKEKSQLMNNKYQKLGFDGIDVPHEKQLIVFPKSVNKIKTIEYPYTYYHATPKSSATNILKSGFTTNDVYVFDDPLTAQMYAVSKGGGQPGKTGISRPINEDWTVIKVKSKTPLQKGSDHIPLKSSDIIPDGEIKLKQKTNFGRK